MLLEASSKELAFTGSTRIQHGCSGLERNWMPFTARIDPQEIFIPVGDSPADASGSAIAAGVFTADDPFTTTAPS